MIDYTFLWFAAETAAAAEESAEGGLAAFGLDLRVFLLQFGAIAIFYLLFRKFALKRIVAILDDRHETIKEGLENAHKAEKASKEAVAEQQKILEEIKEEYRQKLEEEAKSGEVGKPKD